VGLRLANLDFEGKRITVIGKGANERTVFPVGGTMEALQRWIELDFAGLCKAISKAFKNDIPERVYPEWQQWLELNRQAYSDLSQQISFVDGALTKEVATQLPLPQG
jgi:site-specific recombinase XerD